MKKVSVFLIGLLVSVMLAAGCGEPVPEEPVVEEPPIIYIYSSNDEISEMLNFVWEKHEDWKERVECVVLPEEGYVEAMASIIANPETEKYPDVILADIEGTPYFTDADYIQTMQQVGFEENEFTQMYSYTKEYASDKEGNIRGLSWKACPGAFVYRKSVAFEYLGYDDEDNIQSFIKDWDTLIDTARTINKKSGGSVKLLDSVDVLDKAFEKNGYDDFIDNSRTYNAVSQGNVIGYFCDTDVLTKIEKVSGSSKGDWAVCRGPKDFVTGGSWMFVTDKCKDVELTKNIIKELCIDQSILKKINDKSGTFVNSCKVMSNAYNTGKGKIDLLGGGDCIKVLDEVATNVSLEKIEIVEPEEVDGTEQE